MPLDDHICGLTALTRQQPEDHLKDLMIEMKSRGSRDPMRAFFGFALALITAGLPKICSTLKQSMKRSPFDSLVTTPRPPNGSP